MANDVKQKTVIVAGGTGALGASIAKAFLADGARVAVTYQHKEEYRRDARRCRRKFNRRAS